MIGIYDYTVLLTYLSLLSAGGGIVISLHGTGHPYWGCLFLLLCGLFDAFDGKVARTKKNRTQLECNFGIQIDSLCDLVAFGVLPACIGAAMMRTSHFLQETVRIDDGILVTNIIRVILFMILILYILAALIRLAYFNVTEEERQKTEGGVRKYYTGVPVTSASLIFPLVLLIQYVTPFDVTMLYFGMTILTGFLFLSKIQVRKPGLKGILILILIGVLEAATLFGFWLFYNRKAFRKRFDKPQKEEEVLDASVTLSDKSVSFSCDLSDPQRRL